MFRRTFCVLFAGICLAACSKTHTPTKHAPAETHSPKKASTHTQMSTSIPPPEKHLFGPVDSIQKLSAPLLSLAVSGPFTDLFVVKDNNGFHIITSHQDTDRVAHFADLLGTTANDWHSSELPIRVGIFWTDISTTLHAVPDKGSEVLRRLPKGSLLVGLTGQIEGQESKHGSSATWMMVFPNINHSGTWIPGESVVPVPRCIPSAKGFHAYPYHEEPPYIDRDVVFVDLQNRIAGFARNEENIRSIIRIFRTNQWCELQSVTYFLRYGMLEDLKVSSTEPLALTMEWRNTPDSTDTETIEWEPASNAIWAEPMAQAPDRNSLLRMIRMSKVKLSPQLMTDCSIDQSKQKNLGGLIRVALSRARNKPKVECDRPPDSSERSCVVNIGTWDAGDPMEVDEWLLEVRFDLSDGKLVQSSIECGIAG